MQGLIFLLECCCCWCCYSTSEKWEMQRLKVTLRAVHWAFNLLPGLGIYVLCCPHQLLLVTLCLKDPNSLTAPAAAPLLCCATAPPCSSSWPAFEQPQRAALWLPWGIRAWGTLWFWGGEWSIFCYFCKGQWVFGIVFFTVFGSGLSMNFCQSHPPTEISDARMHLWEDI